MGRILDTRFKVTKSRLNFESFDMEMDINVHVMEVVASFSFDEETHDKIGRKWSICAEPSAEEAGRERSRC